MKDHSFRFGWGLSVIVVLAVCGWTVAPAAETEREESVGPILFDIPSQPLDAALNAYAAAVGRDVYYDGALVLGRRSSGVRGMLAPQIALRTLLQGTGFSVRDTGFHSFTIEGPPKGDRTGAVSAMTDRADYQRYFAAVQVGVRRALCRSPETRPGHDQILVKLRLTASGAVSQAMLLSSTGEAERDDAFSNALRSVRVDEAAPPGMPSSITMMVFPRSSDAEECDAVRDGGEIR